MQNDNQDLNPRDLNNRAATYLKRIDEELLKYPPSEPSTATIEQYRKAFARMVRQNLVPEFIGAGSRKSYNLYRAALVWCSMDFLRGASAKWSMLSVRADLAEQKAFLDSLQHHAQILGRYPPFEKDGKTRWKPPAEGAVKRGKRRGLSSLPANWRQMLIEQCPLSSGYRKALIVLAMTGCRPEELARGIQVNVVMDRVRVIIDGAKVTQTSGQPVRWLDFDADNPIATMLRDNGSYNIGELYISIDCPKAFCDFVRGLSRRVFPAGKYTVSPYSFRHAFAADRKAEKCPADQIASMMGHLSEKSQRGYGVARQGRLPLAPVKSVFASRAVKGNGRCYGARFTENADEGQGPIAR